MTADRESVSASLGVIAACGHLGCEWGQRSGSLTDAYYLSWRHTRDAHSGIRPFGQCVSAVWTCSTMGPWAAPAYDPSSTLTDIWAAA